VLQEQLEEPVHLELWDCLDSPDHPVQLDKLERQDLQVLLDRLDLRATSDSLVLREP
jgi:hypothetical protein